MKKDTVSVFNRFNLTQLTAISEYLAEKEAEGLKFSSYTSSKITFKKSEPQKANYSVALYKGSDRDGFVASAEEKGWELIGSYSNVFIFRSENLSLQKVKSNTCGGFSGGGFSFFYIYVLLRFLYFQSGYGEFFATEYEELTGMVLFFLELLFGAIVFGHYIFWRIKAKKALREDEDIPTYNLQSAKRNRLFGDVTQIIIMLIWLFSIYLFGFGYTESPWGIYIEGGIVLLLIADILGTRINFSRKNTLVKSIALGVFVAVFAVGIFFSGKASVKEYENKAVNFLSYGGNPISVTDFGMDKENADDKEPIAKVTSLAEHYIFRSNSKKPGADQKKTYVYYQVLRSEHDKIFTKHENKIRKTALKYNDIVDIESDKWDYLCREYRDGEPLDSGYGKKGNTIVYLDVLEKITFEEFFDMAYEKLF